MPEAAPNSAQPPTPKDLREQMGKLAKDIRDMAATLVGEKKDFTAEENDKWVRLNEDYDETKRKAEIAERAAELEKDLRQPVDKNPPGREDFDGGKRRKEEEGEGREDQPSSDEDRALALQAWCRRGVKTKDGQELKLDKRHRDACKRVGINPKSISYSARFATGDYRKFRSAWFRNESRALSVTQVTGGGATIPEGFVQNLEEALLQFGGIRQVADVLRTNSGNDLPWPTVNDTTNLGSILSENTTVAPLDVPFGQIVFHAYKYTSNLVLVPVELMEDSAFDLAAELGRLLGIRIGRITANHFTTGTGAAQPTGVVTAATQGPQGLSTSAILSDDLYNLKHTVDPAYRTGPGVGFMLHDKVLLVVKKLKDGLGRPLWQASLAGKIPDTIDGDPVYINQSMVNAVASTNKTVLYGDLSKYKIRDVSEFRLRRLIERYADADQVGFIAFSRHDGNLLDAGTHPVAYLYH